MAARGRTIALCVLAAACARRPLRPTGPAVATVAGPVRVVVLPFRAATDDGTLPPDAAMRAAHLLARHLAEAGIAVVEPGTVARAIADGYDASRASRIASDVGASVAAVGTLSRYDERQGTAWAATMPASVAYEVGLVRTEDGAVIARDRFEQTQQALSDNVLALPSFVQAGGRWRTREEMLDDALARTARRLATAIAPPPPR